MTPVQLKALRAALQCDCARHNARLTYTAVSCAKCEALKELDASLTPPPAPGASSSRLYMIGQAMSKAYWEITNALPDSLTTTLHLGGKYAYLLDPLLDPTGDVFREDVRLRGLTAYIDKGNDYGMRVAMPSEVKTCVTYLVRDEVLG